MEYKQNYLNNRDLLLEIHKSKNSYCSFDKPAYHQYDIIVDSIIDINKDTIEMAILNRIARLSNELYIVTKSKGISIKLSECEKEFQNIKKTDVIFRVMANDHLPIQLKKSKNTKIQSIFNDENQYDKDLEKIIQEQSSDKIKVNFPPFQHWKFDENDRLICVGKSHWRGDVTAGKFDQSKGKITDNLAKMMMKLAERYATKGNLRNYTYNDEMRDQSIIQLIEFGLKFNEARSENPFSYLSQIVKNAMIRVLNVEERHRNVRDDILEINGLNPSYTRVNDNEYQHTGINYND